MCRAQKLLGYKVAELTGPNLLRRIFVMKANGLEPTPKEDTLQSFQLTPPKLKMSTRQDGSEPREAVWYRCQGCDRPGCLPFMAKHEKVLVCARIGSCDMSYVRIAPRHLVNMTARHVRSQSPMFVGEIHGQAGLQGRPTRRLTLS